MLLLNAVSATVGLDKQFAMQVIGMEQACACHAFPGETVSECMIACFECNTSAWHELISCLCLLPLYSDTLCTCANTAAAVGAALMT